MPFGRHFELRLAKDEKSSEQPSLSGDPIDISSIGNEIANVIGPKLIKGLLIYMAADTLRQVIVKSTVSR